MNVSRALTFGATPLSLAVSALGTFIAAALCVVAWRRSGYRATTGLLELLRFAIVVIVAVLFNQPEWTEEHHPDERPTVAVFFDSSPSMKTRDAVPSEGKPRDAIARSEAISAILDAAAWRGLEERMDVVIEPFAASPEARGTDLYAPLAAAPRRFRNLRGIVLVSDGDWNEGPPPVEAAAGLRQRGVPIIAVPVGSPTRLPDLELLSLDAPTFGTIGKGVRIPFAIDSALAREHVATVTLKVSDGAVLSKEVRIAPMGRTNDWILWKPEAAGDFTVTVEIPPQSDETIPDNNQLSAPIAVREEKLRVLVIESYPRWEYRYLRNALSRDPGIELSCLLFQPGLAKIGGGNRDYIRQFPEGLDELSRFDVVFLGDVGREEGQLTDEQCRRLKGLVEHQASGLVFMPGWQGRQFSLLETELSDLYPVVLDATQPEGWGSRTPSHFELTELGRRSLLTRLADTPEDNLEVWDELPGFQWYAPILRAKAGSDVLCVHRDIANDSGRIPLLATKTFGAGKILFMGTDGAWRWREGVEDKYHYRFWGQVVRWMAYQRNMAKGETMRFYHSPDQPQLGQTLSLTANVMEPGGEPLQGGEVAVRIIAPSGQSETVQLTSAGDEWGQYSGRFTAEEPGRHELLLTCRETGARLEASFFVQGGASERPGRAARPEVMEELARVTQGKVLGADRVEEVVQSLSALPEAPPIVRRVPLWSHPIPTGSLIALLGIFWILRKISGFV